MGAKGVVVHGGHIGDDEDLPVAWERWRKALESVDLVVPVLIENTAGGGHAAVRAIDNYGPLWEVIGDLNVGVCLDTCHAWAAGEDLETVVARIDGCHRSDRPGPLQRLARSRTTPGVTATPISGKGMIPEDLIVDVVREADAPVVVETPDEDGGQAADIAWLRERLGLAARTRSPGTFGGSRRTVPCRPWTAPSPRNRGSA